MTGIPATLNEREKKEIRYVVQWRVGPDCEAKSGHARIQKGRIPNFLVASYPVIFTKFCAAKSLAIISLNLELKMSGKIDISHTTEGICQGTGRPRSVVTYTLTVDEGLSLHCKRNEARSSACDEIVDLRARHSAAAGSE